MTITEHGYVIRWADGKIDGSTFDTNRHECWLCLCCYGVEPGLLNDRGLIRFNQNRTFHKKRGLRCVPATRTIETEE